MITSTELRNIFKEDIRRDIRQDRFDQGFAVRIRRAISWLERAEKELDDQDAKFILLWIAFNALYSKDHHSYQDDDERGRQKAFFKIIQQIDSSEEICKLIETECLAEVHNIITNKFIQRKFWDYVMKNKLQNMKPENWPETEPNWKNEANKQLSELQELIKGGDTSLTLIAIFENLYILRNQLIHGCATWQSKKYRNKLEEDMDQVYDGCKVLEKIVPLFIKLMVKESNLSQRNLGTIGYPPYLFWHKEGYFLSLIEE